MDEKQFGKVMVLEKGHKLEEGKVFIRVKDESNQILGSKVLPIPGALKNTPPEGDNISCDWDKFCTAKESLDGIESQGKDPKSFFMYSFKVTSLNGMDSIHKIEYHPIPRTNLAHSQIYKDSEDVVVREKMAAIAELELPDYPFDKLRIEILLRKEERKIHSYQSQPDLSNKAKKKLEKCLTRRDELKRELSDLES